MSVTRYLDVNVIDDEQHRLYVFMKLIEWTRQEQALIMNIQNKTIREFKRLELLDKRQKRINLFNSSNERNVRNGIYFDSIVVFCGIHDLSWSIRQALKLESNFN